MIGTVLLVPFLILISYFCGRAMLLIFGVFSGKKKEFFSSVSTGCLMLLFISFVSHFLTVTGSSLLSTEKKIFGILAVSVMTVLYFTFVIMTFVKTVRSANPVDGKTDYLNPVGGKANDAEPGEGKTKDLSTVFAVMIAVFLSISCMVLTASGARLCSEGDETLETVVSFLDNGVMFSVDPIKGMPYIEGLPLRHKILCLPGLYSVLSGAFGISPEILVHHIMPAFWFFAGLCSICSLSAAFFKDDKDVPEKNKLFKRSVFVIFSLVFIFGANLSPYAQGFGIISAMWTGYAVRNWVLAPLMLSFLFRKKYIPALMPVICEVFICRTQYGIGFLACIYVIFIFAKLFAERRRK